MADQPAPGARKYEFNGSDRDYTAYLSDRIKDPCPDHGGCLQVLETACALHSSHLQPNVQSGSESSNGYPTPFSRKGRPTHGSVQRSGSRPQTRPRDQNSIEQASRNRTTRAREKAAREQAAREQAAMEQAAREQTARERARRRTSREDQPQPLPRLQREIKEYGDSLAITARAFLFEDHDCMPSDASAKISNLLDPARRENALRTLLSVKIDEHYSRGAPITGEGYLNFSEWLAQSSSHHWMLHRFAEIIGTSICISRGEEASIRERKRRINAAKYVNALINDLMKTPLGNVATDLVWLRMSPFTRCELG